MEYVVVAFRSRSQTVGFSGLLRSHGIENEIINTPKEAGVGCGLSVKISKSYFSVVKKIVYMARISSFAGFFLVTVVASKKTVRAI